MRSWPGSAQDSVSWTTCSSSDKPAKNIWAIAFVLLMRFAHMIACQRDQLCLASVWK